MNEFITNIAENVTFVLEFLALVAALVAVAVIAEKLLNKRNGNDSKILTTRKVAMIGMFSAVAGIFMILELPMPFAPSFYKIDPSELPVLICGFAFGTCSRCSDRVCEDHHQIIPETYFYCFCWRTCKLLCRMLHDSSGNDHLSCQEE